MRALGPASVAVSHLRSDTMRRLCAALGLILIFAAASGARAAEPTDTGAREEQVRCESLAGGRFTNLPSAPTWVVKATYKAATAKTRAYCAVEGYVNPTVNFGLWLPASNWNGKYIVRGCGGSCGMVVMDLACPQHLREGYACLHTDMGHRSTLSDNNWAADNLQGMVDFGYRATHVATVAGKAIASAYYGADPKISYYFGCSTGGRQGLVEAQRFTDDFDAMVIIAAAPGSSGDYQKARDRMATLNLRADGTSILGARDVYLLHQGVLAACDMNDGVRDGLVGDPRLCRFDPLVLQCVKGQAADCLTPEKVLAARAVYAFGALPGTERDWMGKYIKNPPINGVVPPASYSQSRGDPVVIDSLNDASNPDLRRFKAHGGKLIAVQGWDDPQIDPTRLIDYYEVVTNTMGGPATTRDFFRLFMVPGMEHCSTGSGAYAIDYMGAITAWFEKGLAPDKLVGVHPKPGAPLDFFNIDLPYLDKAFYAFSRPHFAYPKRAVYSGKGDPNLESSFVAR